MKHRFKVEIKVTDTESDRVVNVTEKVDFFNMEQNNGFETSPLSPYNKQLNGRTRTEIVFGNGIRSKDEPV